MVEPLDRQFKKWPCNLVAQTKKARQRNQMDQIPDIRRNILMKGLTVNPEKEWESET